MRAISKKKLVLRILSETINKILGASNDDFKAVFILRSIYYYQSLISLKCFNDIFEMQHLFLPISFVVYYGF